MVNPDAFALSKSNLNPFLFAGVGEELNGSELTILSLLARLGSDPWAEASRLAGLPKAAAADWLVERIGQMPLTTHALGEARATALRLISLLPPTSKAQGAIATLSTPVVATQLAPWAAILMVCGALALGLAASTTHGTVPPAPAAANDRIIPPGQ